MYKTNNMICKDIKTILQQCLNNFLISNIDIIQLQQPTKTREDNTTLYFQILNSVNSGWQYVNYVKEDEELKKINTYKESIQVKISCYKQRLLTDTITDYSSKDIINLIKSYLLSDDGINFLNELNYNILIPSTTDINEFINDSDNYEFLPSLIITFLLKQSWGNVIPTIEKIENKNIINT